MVTLPLSHVDTDANSTSRAARSRPTWLVPVLMAGLLVLIAFLTTGGSLVGPPTQAPNSWVNAALILGGGAGVAALAVGRGRPAGLLSLSLFALLTSLSIASIAWSIAPDQSWEEGGRILAYLAVFLVGLMAAHHSGRGSRDAVLTLTLAATALSIWALGVKVFDLNLYDQPQYGPLLSPFGYWNATGVAGAGALPGLMWIAARTGGRRLPRGLAVAGITLAITVVAMTYSRSAIAAAVIGVILPMFFLRSRRRSVAVFVLGLLGAVPICVEGLSRRAITADGAGSIYNGSSTIAGHRSGAELLFGVIILGTVVLLVAAASAILGWLDGHPQPELRLRLFDRALLGLSCSVPALIIVWLFVNSRGPGGEISHIWTSLTSAKSSGVSGGVDRLGSVVNSRSAYWRQAIAVGDHHLLAGAGLGSFDPAYLRYSESSLNPPGFVVSHAHGYVVETYATLGLIGVASTLALLLAWLRDATRAVLRRAGSTATEFDARWALIGVVIVFGVSSTLDWTWFFPGVALPALFAAGWISGLSRTVTTSSGSAGLAGPADPPRRPISARPGALLLLTVLALISLAAAWLSLGPMRSVQSDAAAQNAVATNRGGTAVAAARSAISQDPLSAAAHDELAAVYGDRGDRSGERDEFMTAIRVQPENPQPYLVFGDYLLCRAAFPEAATVLGHAATLDVNWSASDGEALSDAERDERPEGPPC